MPPQFPGEAIYAFVFPQAQRSQLNCTQLKLAAKQYLRETKSFHGLHEQAVYPREIPLGLDVGNCLNRRSCLEAR